MINNHLRIQNHQVIRKGSKGVSCGTNFWKNKLPKGSIKTQKVTNGPNLISQSEPPALKGIMVKNFELVYMFCLEQQEQRGIA